jgi:hypothetical protein
MTRVRFPSHVSIVQGEFADDPPAAFKPPPARRCVVSVGSSACTLTQDFPADDGGPIDDPHYGPSPRTDAQEQARRARESILRPPGLARMEQPAGDGLSRPAHFNDLRGSK